jgi:2-C-methyl-D-erythritol 2,4-cyclodiphosphate synthase
MSIRIGQGIDTHQLVKGYKLIIGGIEIAYDKGSKGHSDGDVLLHAIVDSLLGAISKGDIGQHFPSNDQKWKNANSTIFLKHAYSLVDSAGYKIQNIDATITLQKPHISKYTPKMKEYISSILNIEQNRISIKATTSDYLGYCGRGEGILANAIVLLATKEEIL